MRRTALTFAVLACLAVTPLLAADVPNKFIITDEFFDFERLSGGGSAFRGYDFSSISGVPVGTQALLVFAQNNGTTLSQYLADHGFVNCINTDYLVVADNSFYLTRDKPVILELSNVLFKADNPGLGDWELRADWQTRLQTFRDRARGGYNANTTLFISVFSEVTGSPLTNSEIDLVAAEVKRLFPPGVKVGAGYPTTTNSDGTDRSLRLPATFPSELDVIVTWDYNIKQPAALPYSDSVWPQNPNTDYGRLINALLAHQDLYFLVAGFNAGDTSSRIHQSSGEYFGTLLRNWCAFAFKRYTQRNAGLIVFEYNDSYSCVQGSCATGNCSGLKRRFTGAQTVFEVESLLGLTTLARAYRAVSRAAEFGESCWAFP